MAAAEHSATTPGADWLGHPRGLSTLFFTELWERFSYYGMRALLVFFMVAAPEAGGLGFETRKAGLIYGTYTMSVYLLTIAGGFIGDRFLGARRAVPIAGCAIALGHFTLALHSLMTFYAGLVLVAVGTGLLKANVSTMVGSLYAPGDPRRDAGFSIFYMGINVGAFVAPLATGALAQGDGFKRALASFGLDSAHSWHWGFGAAGVGMTLGLVYYLATAGRIAHVGHPPEPGAARPWRQLALVIGASAAFFFYALISDDPRWVWLRALYLIAPLAAALWLGLQRSFEAKRMAVVFVLFLAAALFWAGFEQGGSTLALFSDQLTRAEVLGWSFPSAWFQSLNAIFVVLLAPVFAWLWIRLGDRQPSSPTKFALGLGCLGLSFALMIPAARLSAGGAVSPWWLVAVFWVQTVGELCLSPVGLSAMTKLAPARLGGLVMGIWFLGAAVGNKLAGVLAGEFTTEDPARLASLFGHQALALAAAAAAMLALVPWLKRLMGGVK